VDGVCSGCRANTADWRKLTVLRQSNWNALSSRSPSRNTSGMNKGDTAKYSATLVTMPTDPMQISCEYMRL
jgi:hypothetical protein